MSHYRSLRRLIDTSDDALEVKHQARQLVPIRTRGCFTAMPFSDRLAEDPILARAGQELEEPPAPDDMPGDTSEARARAALWAENDLWVETLKTRSCDLSHRHTRRISLRIQWEQDADLVDVERDVRVSLEYDFKRIPVNPIERDGCLAFDTRPPRTVEEFFEGRGAFDKWREDGKRSPQDLCGLGRFQGFQMVSSSAPDRKHPRPRKPGNIRDDAASGLGTRRTGIASDLRSWAEGWLDECAHRTRVIAMRCCRHGRRCQQRPNPRQGGLGCYPGIDCRPIRHRREGSCISAGSSHQLAEPGSPAHRMLSELTLPHHPARPDNQGDVSGITDETIEEPDLTQLGYGGIGELSEV